MNINSQEWGLIFRMEIFFDLNKEAKKELINVLADWIFDKETSYPSFGECKLCIKKTNSNVTDLSTFDPKNE